MIRTRVFAVFNPVGIPAEWSKYDRKSWINLNGKGESVGLVDDDAMTA